MYNMQEYNNRIANIVNNSEWDMIKNTPQPEMFGGNRPRKHPVPDLMYSPSTLAVGGAYPSKGSMGREVKSLGALHPMHPMHPMHMAHRQGAGFWGDLGHGIMNVAKSPIGQKVIERGLEYGLTGHGRKGRPRKHAGAYPMTMHSGAHMGHPQGAGFLEDIGSFASSLLGNGKHHPQHQMHPQHYMHPHGAGFWGDLGHGIMNVANSPIGQKVITRGLEYGLTGHGRRKGFKSPRGELVAKIMKEKGMNLPQASSYVKQNGLYKK